MANRAELGKPRRKELEGERARFDARTTLFTAIKEERDSQAILPLYAKNEAHIVPESVDRWERRIAKQQGRKPDIKAAREGELIRIFDNDVVIAEKYSRVGLEVLIAKEQEKIDTIDAQIKAGLSKKNNAL